MASSAACEMHKHPLAGEDQREYSQSLWREEKTETIKNSDHLWEGNDQ